MTRTRVLIVDDHPILCAGIQSLLSTCEDIEVVGEAQNGEQALARVEELRPDVVIMDIAMPKMNGIEAARLIHRKFPDTRVLTLTQHEEQQYVLPLLKAGVSGIVLKRALVADLINALRTVIQGETFLYPSLATAMVEAINHQDTSAGSGRGSLTMREKEILERIVVGETTPEIASALNLSIKTVEFHRANLMTKMGARNVADLVREALRHGIVENG